MPCEEGYLEAEGLEKTYRIKQESIINEVDILSSRKAFDIVLPGECCPLSLFIIISMWLFRLSKFWGVQLYREWVWLHSSVFRTPVTQKKPQRENKGCSSGAVEVPAFEDFIMNQAWLFSSRFRGFSLRKAIFSTVIYIGLYSGGVRDPPIKDDTGDWKIQVAQLEYEILGQSHHPNPLVCGPQI